MFAFPFDSFKSEYSVLDDDRYLKLLEYTLKVLDPAVKYVRRIENVKNAFIITDYSGYDPEVNSFAFDGLRPGVDMSSFPHARSFIFGLNVSF